MSEVHNFKICIIGKPDTGKSAVVVRLVNEQFIDFEDPTIEDHYVFKSKVDGENFRFDIVDLAGDFSLYMETQKKWFQTADGFVCVYSVTSEESFEEIAYLREIVKKVRGTEHVEGVLLANQCDKDKREVSIERGKFKAEFFDMAFFETSAKSGENISEAFHQLARKLIDQKKNPKPILADSAPSKPPKKQSTPSEASSPKTSRKQPLKEKLESKRKILAKISSSSEKVSPDGGDGTLTSPKVPKKKKEKEPKEAKEAPTPQSFLLMSTLKVNKKKYLCFLFEDSFAYWKDEKAFSKGSNPEASFTFDEAQEPSLVDGSIEWTTTKKKLVIASDNPEETKKWYEALTLHIIKERNWGVPLELAVARAKSRGAETSVPSVVLRCFEFLKGHLKEEGLFRVSESVSLVNELREKFETEKAEEFQIPPNTSVHAVTVVLKSYFKSLPDCLMTFALYDKFVSANKLPKAKKPEAFKKLIKEDLKPANQETLKELMKFLLEVTQESEHNKMNIENLSIVFGPTLIRPEVEDPKTSFLMIKDQCGIVKELLQNFGEIFGESGATPKKKPVVPPKPTANLASKPISAPPSKPISAPPSKQMSLPPHLQTEIPPPSGGDEYGTIPSGPPPGMAQAQQSTPVDDFRASMNDHEPLEQMPWFWGNISRPEAEQLLCQGNGDRFLLRQSSVPGCYACSLRDYQTGQISHILICPSEQGYFFENQPELGIYPMVTSLVKNTPLLTNFGFPSRF